MGQSNHQKMPTDLIRKVLDAKLENNPYDMIIMKHYGCTNLAGLKRARIRDRTFFTDDDGWFCGDLRRFNSPLTGPWPEIKFEPQTDKEIVEWKQKEILI